ncbi:MAG: NAD-dependent epimerase/dehydratase family protein, partial [Nitrosopumilaceae archaeon]
TYDVPKDIFCIIHLAAMVDASCCEKSPTACFETNLRGTQNILEIARKTNAKVIFLSTSHVYGNPQKNPINEDHLTDPLSIYAASKIAGEILCKSYSKSYNIDISVARLFSVYGPRSPDYLVISKIISQILGSNIIKLGNLFPKRDFIYINDVISALELILNKTRGFEIYNIGTGKSYSISDVCKLLTEIASTNIPIVSVRSFSRANEIKEIRADSSKIKRLGWKPITRISDGLRHTFEWYKNNHYIQRKLARNYVERI